ncbi:serine hydrolase domain-containing protein [Paracoccus alkanivorans]|uniref:Class A beta-lactamase-related serine hydrolase n=1 Tax=Paracoccus alkanivorans TaxID=2116655 RepID=A0A3M0LZ18_9RHOB|nr:serine hydrolase domain-containing protein [Paracoccus alkanivorans]RMC30471.1 class A beta-lactamase-related serine hydrolase [Paracoccus alkanivorans]
MNGMEIVAEPDWSAGEAAAVHGLQDWLAEDPGGVVLGFDSDGIRFSAARGCGWPGGNALDADSVFRWASVTKHVFVACLLDSAALALDLPLGKVLPELAPAPGGVTIAQALAMQGGLPDTRESLTLLGLGPHDRSEAGALFDWSAGLERLNAEPGTEVAYSNGGYRLTEVALTRHGVSFADWVAGQARRLGTGMRVSEYWGDPVPGLVPGHLPNAGGWSQGFQGMHLSAAGSLSGSARDLALWLADLIPRRHFTRMARALPLASGEATGYGLGLRLNRIGAASVPGHGGAQPGYRAAFLACPDTRAGVVVLSNRDDADAGGLADRVWVGLMGLRPDRQPAGEWAPPGLYVAPQGNLWAEIRPGSIVVRDAEEPLFAGPDGIVVSAAAQSHFRLRFEDGGISGTMFHRPVRLLPARDAPPDPDLDGVWTRDGAYFRISGGMLHWGSGPRVEKTPLQPLGDGRWLFPASGRRICLRKIATDRMELSLSRSRGIEYVRAG